MSGETEAPKMYVRSLADYVRGVSIGKWFELDEFQDSHDLSSAIEGWLQELDKIDGGSREEYVVHDYQDMHNFGEYPDLDSLDAYMRALLVGASPRALDAFLSYGYEPEDYSEHYYGQFDSDEDLAAYLLEESGELESLPERLRYYFDCRAYARDLMINEFFAVDGYYFWR